jgi:tetratricopeptide (TPR) repeat protein
VINTRTGNLLATLPLEPGHNLRNLEFSPNRAHLASGSVFNGAFVVSLWEISSASLVSRWVHPGVRIARALRWAPDGQYLAVISKGDKSDNGGVRDQQHLHVIRASDGSRILKYHLSGVEWLGGGITSVAWSDDSNLIALGSHLGDVEIFDLSSRQAVARSKMFSSPVKSIAWGLGNQRLACGSEHGEVKICVADQCQDLLTFNLPVGRVTQLAWSHDGQRLAAATNEGTIHTWDASRGYEYATGKDDSSGLAIDYLLLTGSQAGTTKTLALRKFLETAPDERGFWVFRGNAFASLGRFEEAAQEYSKAIGANLQTSIKAGHNLAYALLGSGDMEAYREHCLKMFQAFGNSRVPSSRLRTAWFCSLSPTSPIESPQIVRMVRLTQEYLDKSMVSLPASLYRDQQFDQASQSLQELIDKNRGGDALDLFQLACSEYFLAMTLHKVNKPAQASAMLREANAHAAESKNRKGSWRHIVVLNTLQQEAESLLGEAKSKEGEQEKSEDDTLSEN